MVLRTHAQRILHCRHPHVAIHTGMCKMVDAAVQRGMRITVRMGIKATTQGIKATAQGIKATAQGIKATAQGIKATAQGIKATAQADPQQWAA